MKKVFFIFLMILPAIISYSQTGVIRELTGNVDLKPAGSSVFIPAKAGNEVSQDTIVSTGFKSTVIIAVGSTVISVQPLTRLSLAEISKSANTENLNVNLHTGRIKVDVKPSAGTKANTTVRSPSATASVRGTGFEMDTLNLKVTEGSVNWKDTNGLSTNIPAGFQGSINVNGSIINHIELTVKSTTVALPVGAGISGEQTSSYNYASDYDVNVVLDWNKTQ